MKTLFSIVLLLFFSTSLSANINQSGLLFLIDSASVKGSWLEQSIVPMLNLKLEATEVATALDFDEEEKAETQSIFTGNDVQFIQGGFGSSFGSGASGDLSEFKFSTEENE